MVSADSGSASAAGVLEEVRGHVASLKDKMEARTTIVKQWCEERKEASTTKEKDALERLDEIKERLEKLKDRRTELDSQGYANSIRLESERKRVQDIDAKLEILHEKYAISENEMNATNKAVAEGQEKVAVKEKFIKQAEEAHSDRMGELMHGARLFRKLGLVFVIMPNKNLKLVFTQIDLEDPEQEFSIQVRVTSADQYVVENAEPSIKVESLTTQLNETNDFSKFVQEVRKLFLALARDT